MDPILWRHAEAAEGGPDHARPLTERGRAHAAAVAAWLAPRLPATVRVLASPALRARQTAEALARDFTTVPDLGPRPADGARQALLRAAGWPDAGGAVVVVGHQPTLGQTAAWLLAGRADAWSMRPGGFWWLASGPPGGEPPVVLRAALPPELL